MKLLEVRGLKVAVEGREILHGVNLEVEAGETVVLLGENGAGKTSVVRAVMGMMEGETGMMLADGVTGEIKFEGVEMGGRGMDERARRGMFMSWQAPVEVPGVTMMEMLWAAMEERMGKGVPRREIEAKVAAAVRELKMEAFAAGREVNMGASGGERKKNEILQMMVLEPKLAMLDEVDSGLDVDAAKLIAGVVAKWQRETGVGLLIITHNMRILGELTVDRVYVMAGGRVVETGGRELVEKVVEKGFKE